MMCQIQFGSREKQLRYLSLFAEALLEGSTLQEAGASKAVRSPAGARERDETRKLFFPQSLGEATGLLRFGSAKRRGYNGRGLGWVLLPILVLVAVARVPAADPPTVKVSNVRCVFDNGEHNAFTDLIRWKGKYWLTFRSCPDGHMVFPSSSILILNSTDTKEWTQVHRFHVPKRDTRDPHFLTFRDKLFVYTGTWYCGDQAPKTSQRTLNQHLGYAAWSSDGGQWHSPIMLDGTFGHYVWRAAAYDGKAYLCGRRNHEFDMSAIGEGALVETVMLESEDGLIWRTRTLFQEKRGDETAFLFEPDGRILGVGRSGSAPAQFLQSTSPYTEWERRDFDRYIGGPLLARWGDRLLVGGRKSTKGGPRTSLYWLNPDAETKQGLLTEFAELPSGGDTSYPGFIPLSEKRGIVSWYSSHEKGPDHQTITAIYMADLEIE